METDSITGGLGCFFDADGLCAAHFGGLGCSRELVQCAAGSVQNSMLPGSSVECDPWERRELQVAGCQLGLRSRLFLPV